MTTSDRRLGDALVAVQFGLILLCLLPVGPTIGSGQLRPVGLVCLGLAALVGGLALLAMGSDTRVHPVPAAQTPLRVTGIYAWIRHPMYAAVLLATLGVTLSSARVLSLLAFLALIGVLHAKAEFEDRMLQEKFGGQFADYASRVPALIPRPRRLNGP
jgi:protein-S-isoprenylcysteine O-methyltransferase Ste14